MYLSLALAVSILAALPLLVGPGIVNTRAGGDSPFLVQRVYELAENLRAGAFPARWMPHGAHGLGYAFFGYYASLPYYIAAALSLAGWGVLWGIKLTQALGFVLAGFFSYNLARRLGAGGPGALLASAAYTLAPFHLANVYVRGDSLSEFYAYAWYPLVLLGAVELRRRATAGRFAVLAGGYALLVLTHNVSAMLFSPLVVAWIVVDAAAHARGRVGRAIGLGAGALALGLVLSAGYWLPALRERSLVQLQEQTTGYLHYAGHFRGEDLVQWRPIHDYRIDATGDPFGMGLAQAALGLAGAVAALAAPALRVGAGEEPRGRRARWPALLLVGALAGYTWLITPTSRVVWDSVPLLEYAQFPWRMLSVQALLVALLGARVPALVGGRWRAPLAGALVALLGAAGMGGLRVDRLPITEADVTPERLMLYETYSGNIGSTVRHEYLPAGMVPRPHVSAVQLGAGGKPPPLALEGVVGAARALVVAPGREEWEIALPGPALLAFHTAFLPGWTATVDGAPHPVQPLEGLGLVGLRLEAGTHRVGIAYRGTRTQRYATLASTAALGVWLGLVLGSVRGLRRRSRADVLRGMAPVLGAAAVAMAGVVIAPAIGGSAGADGLPVMDFVRAPYLHAEPGGVWMGGSRLEGYRYSTDRPEPGGRLDVYLDWGEADGACHARLDLRAATAHLYEPAPTWASADAPPAPGEQMLTLALPEDLPPGLYAPTLTVDCGGEPAPVRTALGQGMGSPALAPILVEAAREGVPASDALGHFGPESAPPVIALLGARAALRGGDVEVSLEWRAERTAPLNYALSVRVLSAAGDVVASRDLPPLLGVYPTSLWRPGVAIADRVLLAAPEGLDPEGAGVEIILYDRRTLRAAGTVRVERAFDFTPPAP